MQERWTEQLAVEEIPASDGGGDGRYCPECGQSLDLARLQETPVKRRTLEPFVFLVFGLCLTVAFGLRAGHSATRLSSLDQVLAALNTRAEASRGILPRPGNPSMIVADTMGEVLTEQLDERLALQRDLTGLGIGLLTLIVGSVSWLHERPERADRRRNRAKVGGLPSSGQRPDINPYDVGGLVAMTLVRMVLLLFVIIVGLQVSRGHLPSIQLLDQALTRITTIVLTVSHSLS